jgi:hypothetical protein
MEEAMEYAVEVDEGGSVTDLRSERSHVISFLGSRRSVAEEATHENACMLVDSAIDVTAGAAELPKKDRD